MKQLWAPWRIEFLISPKPKGCIFCAAAEQNKDQDNLILYRSSTCYIIMNAYPYNTGHLMIIPFQHEKDFDALSEKTLLDLSQTLQKSVQCLRKVFQPDGINIGMNLGAAAGAGIPGHLHYHVIPRWVGDTSFLPILGDVRVMNEYLKETYKRLKAGF